MNVITLVQEQEGVPTVTSTWTISDTLAANLQVSLNAEAVVEPTISIDEGDK